MCDVRKTAVRMVLMGLAAGLVAASLATAKAQSTSTTIKRKQESHARRETNASRQARIQRTIDETYAHRWEVFGGGGYLRFRSGEYTKKNSEISWAAATNYYLNPKLAIVGDARGSFGNAHALINNTYGVYNPQINEYTFMGGASYRFYEKEKVAVSVQGLGGIGWGIFSGGAKGLTGTQIGLWPDGFKPAFSVGVSADYNFFPNLAFRVTPTYVGTTFGSTVQNNIGLNAGIIYRFGHK
jgi:Ni/Co efflux regulator RcnB